MSYVEFRDSIHRKLRKNSSGMTWIELKTALDLPYDRPCPEWVRQLEKELSLVRRKEPRSRAYVWRLKKT